VPRSGTGTPVPCSAGQGPPSPRSTVIPAWLRRGRGERSPLCGWRWCGSGGREGGVFPAWPASVDIPFDTLPLRLARALPPSRERRGGLPSASDLPDEPSALEVAHLEKVTLAGFRHPIRRPVTAIAGRACTPTNPFNPNILTLLPNPYTHHLFTHPTHPLPTIYHYTSYTPPLLPSSPLPTPHLSNIVQKSNPLTPPSVLLLPSLPNIPPLPFSYHFKSPPTLIYNHTHSLFLHPPPIPLPYPPYPSLQTIPSNTLNLKPTPSPHLSPQTPFIELHPHSTLTPTQSQPAPPPPTPATNDPPSSP
jgi:hypothetical protein